MNLETQRKVRESKTPGREDIAEASVAEERRPRPVTATPRTSTPATLPHPVPLPRSISRHAGKIEGRARDELFSGQSIPRRVTSAPPGGTSPSARVVGAVSDAGAQVRDSMAARTDRSLRPRWLLSPQPRRKSPSFQASTASSLPRW